MITSANYGIYVQDYSEPAWYAAERYDYCDGYSFIGRKHIQLHALLKRIKALFS